MSFQATIRYGRHRVRYHTVELAAADLASALLEVAETTPEAIMEEADLVEIRESMDPEARPYLGE